MRRFTHTFPQRISAFLLCLALLVGLLPVTALAAAPPENQVLYVGGVLISSTGYWTTSEDGKTLTSVTSVTELNNYIHYDADDNTLTLHNATIKEQLDYSENIEAGTYIFGSAIGVLNQNGAAELTITLEGTNTIAEVGKGIFVLASSTSTGGATLTITGGGSLNASGSLNGIMVQSNSGDATLTIQSADVTLTSNSGNGVTVQAGSAGTQGHTATLTVNGGKLTASGAAGIEFNAGNPSYNITTELTVSGNALVDTRNGGIEVYGTGAVNTTADDDATNGGIVFDGNTGTVYGDVTLDESLTINQGETLTIPEGATLDTNGNLTNNGKIINNGTLTGEVGGSGTVTPKITTDSPLPKGTVGQSYTASLQATGNNITWSVTSGSLPVGLTLESSTGVISGTPTVDGTFNFTVKATNGGGSDSRAFILTVTAPPEPEPEPTPPPYIPPTYAVTAPETTGGTVEVSPSRASSGRRVTITTQPAPGYELESLTVLDSRGSEIALTAQGDGKYTFTMPASRVTVQASFAPVPLPFEDVPPGAWYEEAVRYAYTHGIMEGMSATTFVPGKSLTRAEAVQVLYNLEGQPTVSESTTFPDLVYQWYKPAIAWAESTGVVDGYEDGTFRPGQPVTREELAQMLYDYAAYKGYDLTAEGDLSAFPDGDQVQKWALPAMTWANGNALINGHDDGTLEPGGTTIRAQAASILMRFDQKLVE